MFRTSYKSTGATGTQDGIGAPPRAHDVMGKQLEVVPEQVRAPILLATNLAQFGEAEISEQHPYNVRPE